MVISCLASVPVRKYIWGIFLHIKRSNWFPASNHSMQICCFILSSYLCTKPTALCRLLLKQKQANKKTKRWFSVASSFFEDLYNFVCLGPILLLALSRLCLRNRSSNSSLLHQHRPSQASVILPMLIPLPEVPSLHYPHFTRLVSFLDTI